MLGLDRTAARAAWTVFVVAVTLVAVYYVRKVLLVFVLALLFAYVLSPLVDLLDRSIPGHTSRSWSLGLVYVLLVGLLISLGFLLGQKINEEARTLADNFPRLSEQLQHRLSEPGPAYLEPIRRHLLALVQERMQNLATVLGPLVQKLTEHVVSFLSGVVFAVLIPILAFFFLKDGRELREAALTAVHPVRRVIWEDIFADIHVLLGQFIRALIVLSIATFAFYSLFFLIVGMPYGVLIAATAAVFEFIPIVGPFAAAVIVVLVATFTGFGHLLLLVAFLAGYRIFQDYILNPHLMSAGVALHPLLVIFGALAGGEIAGIPGIFLSVPILATLRVIYMRIMKARVVPSPSVSAPTLADTDTTVTDRVTPA